MELMVAIGHGLSVALRAAALAGVAVALLQLVVLWRHLRRPPVAPAAVPAARPPISILKPLCGLDDELAENLRLFAELPYPDYEVLLGLRGTSDPAYAIAWAVARRWPSRFRVVLQDGAPGLNPKVNQLITLAAAARHDIWVVSDSNTRVGAGHLDEIAALLADDGAGVGLVTHPIAGDGEDRRGARVGSVMDGLHMTGAITPTLVAASRLFGKSYVVGKSMAMRRRDVEALGGFQAVKDVVAEDLALGRLVPRALGQRVVLARSVVTCVSVRRTTAAFVQRYARWAVIQRRCIGLAGHALLVLLQPVVLAAAALALVPSRAAAAVVLFCVLARAANDALAARLLRGRSFAARALLWGPAKELLAAVAWLQGFFRRTVEWRKSRLIVSRGGVLLPARPRPAESDRGRASAAA
jgi:ceramide glucosyltransferase